MVAVTGRLLLSIHFLQHLEKEQIGYLCDIGNGVGDVIVPHYFAEQFERVLYLGAVHVYPLP